LESHEFDAWLELNGLPDLSLAALPEWFDQVVAAHPRATAFQVEPQDRLAFMVWATERLRYSEQILSRTLLGCCESVCCGDSAMVSARGSPATLWSSRTHDRSLRVIRNPPNRSSRKLNECQDDPGSPEEAWIMIVERFLGDQPRAAKNQHHTALRGLRATSRFCRGASLVRLTRR